MTERKIIRAGNILQDIEGKALSVCNECARLFRTPQFDRKPGSERTIFQKDNLCPVCLKSAQLMDAIGKIGEGTGNSVDLSGVEKQIEFLNEKFNTTILGLSKKRKQDYTTLYEKIEFLLTKTNENVSEVKGLTRRITLCEERMLNRFTGE